MKITRIGILLLLVLSLAACSKEVPVEATLELIGEETVRIKEGEVYEDQGILVNGEKESVSYLSNVNENKVGTYYIQYEYDGQEIMRTVIVEPGAKTEYLEFVSHFESLNSYTYEFLIDVRFTKGDTEYYRYIHDTYDVYGNYLFGTSELTPYSGTEEYTRNEYRLLKPLDNKQETYEFDEYSYWYYENPYYERPTSLLTEFNLKEVTHVTKEVDGDTTVYQAYMTFQGYIFAYNTKINMIPDVDFTHELEDYVIVEVTVVNGNITKIDADLSTIMNDAITNASFAEDIEYTITYNITNHDTVEEIVLPQEALEAKEIFEPLFD